MIPMRMGVALGATAQAESIRRTLRSGLERKKITFSLLIPNRRTGKCIAEVRQGAFEQHASCTEQHESWGSSGELGFIPPH